MGTGCYCALNIPPRRTVSSINSKEMAHFLKPSYVVFLAVGAYNPPTNMHLRMFELAKDYFCKSGHQVLGGIISPVHDLYGKKGLLPAVHRIAMVKLAVQSSDWIHFSDWETQQEGWSRTAVSLNFHKRALHELNSTSTFDWVTKIQKKIPERNPNDPVDIKVKLLCGADLLESFSVPGLWKDEDIENIVRNYGLVVITRSDCNPKKFIYESDLLTRLQDDIDIVPEWITNEISSTKIRRALRRQESVKYLIQDPVIDYIKDNNLYSS